MDAILARLGARLLPRVARGKALLTAGAPPLVDLRWLGAPRGRDATAAALHPPCRDLGAPAVCRPRWEGQHCQEHLQRLRPGVAAGAQPVRDTRLAQPRIPRGAA